MPVEAEEEITILEMSNKVPVGVGSEVEVVVQAAEQGNEIISEAQLSNHLLQSDIKCSRDCGSSTPSFIITLLNPFSLKLATYLLLLFFLRLFLFSATYETNFHSNNSDGEALEPINTDNHPFF